MKAQHTPGPWEVSDGSIIADKICISVIESDGGYEAEPEVRKANAHLIASAPYLLESLEKIAVLYENLEQRTMHELAAVAYDMRCISRSAIAKVKGEQQ